MTEKYPSPAVSSKMPLKSLFSAKRSNFWTFVAIFSVTVFIATIQMASKYVDYCNTTNRLSLPSTQNTSPVYLANVSSGSLNQQHEIAQINIEETHRITHIQQHTTPTPSSGRRRK